MTGPDKLLTISVAAYNAEPYLERCISSSFPVRMQHVCVKSLS